MVAPVVPVWRVPILPVASRAPTPMRAEVETMRAVEGTMRAVEGTMRAVVGTVLIP